MERAAFLNDATGERMSCLLNPASVVVRRTAGLRQRRTLMGQATGPALADAPLLFTGGGSTELELELFFDISLAGSSVMSQDVRDLTHPFWMLSENLEDDARNRRLPPLRFVWGKAWNIPVVVAAVAERVEHFTIDGIPRRSLLTIRLLRAVESPLSEEERSAPSPAELANAELNGINGDVVAHEVTGGVSAGQGERLDELARRYYGDPSYWRLLANFNDIDNPHQVGAGTVLQVPPASPGTGDL